MSSAAHNINPTSELTNWRNRVRAELSTVRNWHADWGFLVEGNDHASHKKLEQFKSEGVPKSMLGLSLKDEVRTKVERSKSHGADSLDSFVEMHLMRTGGHALRMKPQEQFKRPVLTSHQIGWGQNLERFGQMTLRLR